MPDAKNFQLNLPLVPTMPPPNLQSLPWLIFSWAFWKTFFNGQSTYKLYKIYKQDDVLNCFVAGSRVDRLSAERRLGGNCRCSWPEWLRVDTENFEEEFQTFCAKPRARIAVAVVDILGEQNVYLEKLEEIRKSICGSIRELKTFSSMIHVKSEDTPLL